MGLQGQNMALLSMMDSYKKFLALSHASSIVGTGLGVSETLAAGLAIEGHPECRNQERPGAQIPQPQDSF